MASLLTDVGEEWMIKNDLDNFSVKMGLYDDSVDSITDSEDIDDITTEPTDGSYSRKDPVSISARDISGDWGISNDSQISFNVDGTSGSVNSYFFVANFQSSDKEDGSPNNHLVVTGSLSQSYDLSNINTLNISAETAGITVS